MQKEELRYAHAPDEFYRHGYLKSDFDYPELNYELLDYRGRDAGQPELQPQ